MTRVTRTGLLAIVVLSTALGLPGLASAKEYTVTGKEFKFVPNAITVTRGEDVTIVFENAGAISHNLTLSGLGLETRTIQTGATDTIRFTAPQAGTFRFYCAVPGHKEAGMRGRLTVE